MLWRLLKREEEVPLNQLTECFLPIFNFVNIQINFLILSLVVRDIGTRQSHLNHSLNGKCYQYQNLDALLFYFPYMYTTWEISISLKILLSDSLIVWDTVLLNTLSLTFSPRTFFCLQQIGQVPFLIANLQSPCWGKGMITVLCHKSQP